jgi:glycosyltransferase involved in cell wall biosynthesis
MSFGTRFAAGRLGVTLLHNYREVYQPSMRLYADRLGKALLRWGVAVERIRPPRLVPEPWRRNSWLWQKIDDYGGEHLVYPRLLRRARADVVHIIDSSQGHLLAHLDVRRTVVTSHDTTLLALAEGRIGGIRVPRVAVQRFRLSLRLARQAAAIITGSCQSKRDLVDMAGIDPTKVKVVPYGLNHAFAPDKERGMRLRRRLGLGPGLLILQIGRNFYKNIRSVLRVLHSVRKGGLDARIVRTGPPLAGEDRLLAERLNLVPKVIELGMVPDASIPALYNAADLLLFPSTYEGFGWPPLEAMASGTPVVCSRAGALDEVVGDAALTADPEDTEMLAWHVGTVLTDERVRASLVARGLPRAGSYTWDRAAAQTIDLYREVATASC